jgi:hypothetical protein
VLERARPPGPERWSARTGRSRSTANGAAPGSRVPPATLRSVARARQGTASTARLDAPAVSCTSPSAPSGASGATRRPRMRRPRWASAAEIKGPTDAASPARRTPAWPLQAPSLAASASRVASIPLASTLRAPPANTSLSSERAARPASAAPFGSASRSSFTCAASLAQPLSGTLSPRVEASRWASPEGPNLGAPASSSARTRKETCPPSISIGTSPSGTWLSAWAGSISPSASLSSGPPRSGITSAALARTESSAARRLARARSIRPAAGSNRAVASRRSRRSIDSLGTSVCSSARRSTKALALDAVAVASSASESRARPRPARSSASSSGAFSDPMAALSRQLPDVSWSSARSAPSPERSTRSSTLPSAARIKVRRAFWSSTRPTGGGFSSSAAVWRESGVAGLGGEGAGEVATPSELPRRASSTRVTATSRSESLRSFGPSLRVSEERLQRASISPTRMSSGAQARRLGGERMTRSSIRRPAAATCVAR